MCIVSERQFLSRTKSEYVRMNALVLMHVYVRMYVHSLSTECVTIPCLLQCPQLQSKVKSLESSLGKVVKEFEEDKERWIRRSQDEAHQLQ